MNTCDDWRLTIHHWPRATEAGVRPEAVTGFDPDPSPALYQPHDLDFSYPPSRADFFAVVMQTPWMSVWKDDLLPLVSRQPWPMIDAAHKGSSVDLTDDQGRVIGKLEVWRKSRYCNEPYRVPMLVTYPGSDIDQYLKRRVPNRDKREQAREHVRAEANVILERLSLSDDPQVLDEVQRVLVEGGFVRRKQKARLAATA